MEKVAANMINYYRDLTDFTEEIGLENDIIGKIIDGIFDSIRDLLSVTGEDEFAQWQIIKNRHIPPHEAVQILKGRER